MLLNRYSPTPYHYATRKVCHYPRALTKEASDRERAFVWGQGTGALDRG